MSTDVNWYGFIIILKKLRQFLFSFLTAFFQDMTDYSKITQTSGGSFDIWAFCDAGCARNSCTFLLFVSFFSFLSFFSHFESL
jgi:hypothetical protein